MCGPEKDTCIANLTMKDKMCLIPCDGLYADIADNSLKQNMMKGQKTSYVFVELSILLILIHSGFEMITNELGKGNFKQSHVLQQQCPTGRDFQYRVSSVIGKNTG